LFHMNFAHGSGSESAVFSAAVQHGSIQVSIWLDQRALPSVPAVLQLLLLKNVNDLCELRLCCFRPPRHHAGSACAVHLLCCS
jgi:hypothetical protein